MKPVSAPSRQNHRASISAQTLDSRESGISVVGELRWGTHFCQFYQTKHELLSALIPYFKAGLENNEFCILVTSEFLTTEEVRTAMQKKIPDFSKYLEKNQIEFFNYKDWYLKDGKLDMQTVLKNLVKKYDQALKHGFAGVRVSGDSSWLDYKKDWNDFVTYGAEINKVIHAYKLLMLCTYSLEKCDASAVIDIIRNHELVLIKRNGRFENIESASYKKIEQVLTESENRYHQLFNSMKEGFALHEIICDAEDKPCDYRFLDVNPAFERLTGLRRAEILGKTAREVLPGLEPSWIEAYGKVALTGEGCHFESYTQALDRNYEIFVHRSAPRQFAVIFKDITERKDLENLLQQKAQEQEIILDTVPAMVYYKDKENRFVRTNRTFEDAKGMSKSELKGKSLFEIYPEEQAERYWQEDKKIIQSGKPLLGIIDVMDTVNGVRVIRKDKIPYRDESGNVIGVITFGVDVTRQEEIKQALRTSEEHARILSEVMPQIVWSTDNQGLVNYCNRRAYEYAGVKVNDCENWDWQRFIHPDDWQSTQAIWEKSIQAGKPHALEHRLRRADGRYRWHLTRGVPVRDKKNEIIRWIGTATDIHKQKIAKQELQQLNRTLKALSNSNQAILHAKEESEYLTEVCKIIVQDCGHMMAWIGYVEDNASKAVQPVASAGVEEGYLQSLKISWDSNSERGRGPIGTAIRTGKPSVCSNMLTDPLFKPWREEALKRGYASSVVFPLSNGERVFGAITIYSSKPDPFSPAEKKLLSQLANNLAYGIMFLRLRKSEKESEQAILHAKKEWEKTFDSVPDLIAIIDSEYRIVRANRAMAEKLKVSPKECVGLNCHRCVHKLEGVPNFCPHAKTLEDGNEHFAEVHEEILGGDFLISTTPIFDESGKTLGSVHVARDITVRKKMERALQETEERYRTLILASPDAVLVQAKDKLKFINPAGLKLFGAQTIKEILEQSILNFVPAQSKNTFKKYLRQFESGRFQPIESKFKCLDGNLIDVDIVGKIIKFKGRKALQFIIRDITERKQAQAILLKSEQRLRQAEATAHLGNWELDLIRNHLVWSDEVYRIFGLKPQQFTATYEAFLDCVHPDDRGIVDAAYVDSIKTNQDDYEIEHRIIKKSTGEIRTVQEKCHHIRDAAGKVIRSTGVVYDITEQKKIDRAKTEFISLTAHQLRTPLATVSLSAELLLKDLGSADAEIKQELQSIYDDVAYMSDLVSVFLDVSRYELGVFGVQPVPSDPTEILDQCVKDAHSLIREKQLTLEQQITKQIPEVKLDKYILKLALGNLISNAVKYTPAHGQITVSLTKNKTSLIFQVRDSGCGIPAADQSQLFRKLYRASNVCDSQIGGIGLGLYLAKNLIEKSGGKIYFKSKENQGSTFCISIPLTGMIENKIRAAEF